MGQGVPWALGADVRSTPQPAGHLCCVCGFGECGPPRAEGTAETSPICAQASDVAPSGQVSGWQPSSWLTIPRLPSRMPPWPMQEEGISQCRGGELIDGNQIFTVQSQVPFGAENTEERMWGQQGFRLQLLASCGRGRRGSHWLWA